MIITAEKLNELMAERKPNISYNKNLAEKFLKIPYYSNANFPSDVWVDHFTDYILSQGFEEEIVL